MSTLAQIRAAIVAKLSGVAGIGVVNDFERYAREASKFKTFYQASPTARLLGWHVRNVATRELLVDTGRHLVDHTWNLRGFMAIDDADGSEKLLDDLVELARDAFRLDDTLGGTVSSCNTGRDEEIGLQKIDSGPVMFAGVLCHSVRLKLTTRDYT